jgi:hypothetical protein
VKVRKAILLFTPNESPNNQPNNYDWLFEVTDISHTAMPLEELDKIITSKTWYTLIDDVGIELKTNVDFSNQEMYDLLASKMYGKLISKADLMQYAVSKLALSRFIAN